MIDTLLSRSMRVADDTISLEAMSRVLQVIADTPSPSGAATVCRGPVVQMLCKELEITETAAVYRADADASGCDTVSLGDSGIRFLAHQDEISYLLAGPPKKPGWPLLPYCYHLAELASPARLIRFDPHGGYHVAASGTVHTVEGRPYFTTPDGVEPEQGDRVTLFTATRVDPITQQVTAALDNAAGVACCLLAAATLAQSGVPFSLLLTDEEEGPPGSASQTISRGATRLYRRISPAPLTVAVDIHGLSEADRQACGSHERSWGASIAEASSSGRGSVTPPHLYRAVRQITDGLAADYGLTVRPNLSGHVPRSDDVVAMLETNRLVVLGYPGSNRHFDRGLPTANLLDLQMLSKALVALGCAVASGLLPLRWR